MAAVDRRNPNLDDFVGLNWSCWVDGVNIFPSDAGSNTEDSSKYGRTNCETMTLMKEDMHIYGHCPAHDEIYLVVCSHCGQVVKPQAFEKHCERRHGHLTVTCSPSPDSSCQKQPRSGHPTSDVSISTEKQAASRGHDARGCFSKASPVNRPTKGTESSSVETFPQDTPPPLHLHSSSTLRPRVPPWHSGPLPPGLCSPSTSPSERPSTQKPTAGQSSQTQSPLRGMRTYSRMNQNNLEKEFDLNKHSEGPDPERKKLCSQELMCKQKKTSEHPRASSAGQNIEQLSVKMKDKLQHLKDKTTQGSKNNLNSSCHIARSRAPLESFSGKENDSTAEVEIQPSYALNQTMLSSDEDEADTQEEATDLPATPWHPKPLGLCTFGCRTLGCSIFTFDRRWHHLQFALSAMLEHHVNTHLWKNMSQVPSGLSSRHHTSLNVKSLVKNGARLSKSSHTLRLDSTSLATKGSNNYANRTKTPSTIPASRSPSQACSSPVGRHSKAHPKGVELMLDANSEANSSKFIRDHEKDQQHIACPKRPANGSFSCVKKPCPPLQSLSSRGRPPGVQQRVMDCDRSGPAQKRKGRKESKPLSSPISRTSKCQRLSPPHSNILTWKGESNRNVLAWGRERGSDC
ncbi:ataxin-7-like protein 2b isoform X2 [Halichoeres trimaculatus]|uniref:ataxin-7-like protein 2b isoform X2 n=1 Tax=Halichoeres trimaculatus TaxID=147232 RepID=UPI003D9E04E6